MVQWSLTFCSSQQIRLITSHCMLYNLLIGASYRWLEAPDLHGLRNSRGTSLHVLRNTYWRSLVYTFFEIIIWYLDEDKVCEMNLVIISGGLNFQSGISACREKNLTVATFPGRRNLDTAISTIQKHFESKSKAKFSNIFILFYFYLFGYCATTFLFKTN